MDRYAVFGNPIGHSRSPRIHALFAAQTGEELSYSAVMAPRDGFAVAVRQFVARGGRGANVTVPFKLDALATVDAVAPAAQRAGAVNTIIVELDGRLRGDNTDGTGLVRDLLANLGVVLDARRVLVIGAGGAVRGILQPLLDAGVGAVRLANRTPANAASIVAAFADPRLGLHVANERPYDLVINGTSAGLTGGERALPEGVFATGATAYDLSYGAAAAGFLRWANDQGARAAYDGLGMLVEQAAESFWLWRGVRPATASVIEHLRKDIQI